MLPEYRVATLATGIIIAAAAPIVVLRLRGATGWTLGLLAWSWGWSRILISFAEPPADLQTRLMVYAFIAATASGIATAAALVLTGRTRGLVLAAAAAAGTGFGAWYAFDHDAWLGGRIPALSLIFPVFLASLGMAGLAAIIRSRQTGAGQHYLWLGIGLLALPAYRGMDMMLGVIVSDFWTGKIAVTESLLNLATLVFLIAAGAMVARGEGPTLPLSTIVIGIVAGAIVSVLNETMDPMPARHVRYLLDGLVVLGCAATMLACAFPFRTEAADASPIPAQGP